MDLKTEDLRAFLKVFEVGTFSQGASELGLTQSALSQKIARLENQLLVSLFVRSPRKVIPTSSGEKLFLYAKAVLENQNDFLRNFQNLGNILSGVKRVASFSSVMRSVVMPRLWELMRINPEVDLQFSSHEIYELEGILKINQADYIVTDFWPQMNGLECHQVGSEEYVVIESKNHKNIPHIFFDHGPDDNSTSSFFAFQGWKEDYQRRYVGDVYAIIDCVAQGLGKAVMSKHLIDFQVLRIKKAPLKYQRPLVLSYYKQSYYGPLHEKIIQSLLS